MVYNQGIINFKLTVKSFISIPNPPSKKIKNPVVLDASSR